MNVLRRSSRRRAEINIVPLVDVLTSLIFFFLLTMQFKEIYAVDITPPSMKSSESVSKNKPATVSVSKNGKFYWNADEISESALESKIRETAASETPELIVLGDRDSSLQNVMKVVDLARLSKVKNFPCNRFRNRNFQIPLAGADSPRKKKIAIGRRLGSICPT